MSAIDRHKYTADNDQKKLLEEENRRLSNENRSLELQLMFAWVAAALLAVSTVGAHAGCSGREPIKLLALNIANGFGDEYRTPACREAQRDFIRSRAPDAVALQEVDRGTWRSGLVDVDREVTEGGYLTYAAERVVDVGHTGNSLWVRDGATVLEEWVVEHDRSAWVGDRLASDSTPRASACARVEFGGGRRLTACSVHLTAGASFPDGSPAPAAAIRERQIAQVAGFDPDVIMGDLNALDYELEPQMTRLGYSAATHGELEAIWWKLKGKGWMVPAHEASDHPGAAEAIAE